MCEWSVCVCVCEREELTVFEVFLHHQLILLLVAASNHHEVLRANEPAELLKPAVYTHDVITCRIHT